MPAPLLDGDSLRRPDNRSSSRSVREALGLGEGDRVVFRVEGHRAVLARTPDLLDLAGAVDVPAEQRGASWDEVRRRTRAARFHPRP